MAALGSLEELEGAGGLGGAVGDFGGVYDEGAGVGGFVEGGEEGEDVGLAFADGGGLGSTGGALDGVAQADVPDLAGELGEGSISVPGVAEEDDGVEVEGEEGASGGAHGCAEGGEGLELGAPGDEDAESVGELSDLGEGCVEEGLEGLVARLGGGGWGGGDGAWVWEEDGPGEEGVDGFGLGGFGGRGG